MNRRRTLLLLSAALASAASGDLGNFSGYKQGEPVVHDATERLL